uniref:hypothetical protein n=1 Tax=uncultured Caulobacter sp. TaxID=158749 RepID=UPI0025EA3FDB|nr:hypothetical protein [uncultured Caulobacter sp.]
MTHLALPDIPAMSDDTLDDALPWLDGGWSRQTRGLVEAHRATGLDLNRNWAEVPRSWQCPCCQRTKAQIVRLSEHGVLLCHLEWHHDHLRDYGKAVLRHRNSLPENSEERYGIMSALEATKDFCERFFTTLVCKDCNLAEGEAKRLLADAPRDFSFSPAEIKRFIRPRPNQPHRIDEETAIAVWQEVRTDVEDRIAFVAVLAERVAQGRHRRQSMRSGYSRVRSPLEIAIALAAPDWDFGAIYSAAGVLSERSVRRDGQGSAGGKRRAKPSCSRPTQAEVDAFAASQHPGSPWLIVRPDWRCPVCDRDRQAVLRKSNKGRWTGKLQAYAVFETETDPWTLMFHDVWDDATLVFREHHSVWLCGDCRHVITDLKAARATTSDYPFSVNDLRSLVTEVQPNARPEVDLAAAALLCSQRLGFQDAAARYFAHHSRCIVLASRFQALVVNARWSPADAYNVVFSEAIDAEPSASHSDERIKWQLEEGRRFLEKRGYQSALSEEQLNTLVQHGSAASASSP